MLSVYSIIAVVYPNKFLDAEDIANNFLFNADRLVGSHISNGQSLIFFQVAPDAHIQLMWPRLGPSAPKNACSLTLISSHFYLSDGLLLIDRLLYYTMASISNIHSRNFVNSRKLAICASAASCLCHMC